MANSTQPAFIDQFLAKIRALPACQDPVEVYDGLPGPSTAPLMVCVAGQHENAAAGPRKWAELGALAQWEEYEVLFYVWSWVGGDDNAAQHTRTIADAQKAARDNAFTVFNAIDGALRADVNFLASNIAAGGTFPLVLWCNVAKVDVKETPITPGDDGSMGRACEITAAVFVKARI